MTQTLSLPIGMNLSAEGGLSAYVRAVNAAPLLSAEEERQLAQRLHQEGDLDAARQLVVSHLRYVVRVARGFSGYGLPQADLIQEGNIGLMKAVRHFDPAHGVRLFSFAIHWIRAEIYDFVLRNWRIVKVATTKAQRKLFFNLRKSRSRIGWMNQDEVDNLAASLDVPTDTVKEMESRMTNTDVPFDAHDDTEDDEFHASPAGYLKDMRYNPESLYAESTGEAERGKQLSTALADLDPRSRAIIQRRWLDDDKPTLHDLAHEYGVSAERIRQIEKKALTHMKEALDSGMIVAD
ncbi:MAG: RNA polymerase sigma factor RpoH [Acidiferrobacterales bacterium]